MSRLLSNLCIAAAAQLSLTGKLLGIQSSHIQTQTHNPSAHNPPSPHQSGFSVDSLIARYHAAVFHPAPSHLAPTDVLQQRAQTAQHLLDRACRVVWLAAMSLDDITRATPHRAQQLLLLSWAYRHAASLCGHRAHTHLRLQGGDLGPMLLVQWLSRVFRSVSATDLALAQHLYTLGCPRGGGLAARIPSDKVQAYLAAGLAQCVSRCPGKGVDIASMHLEVTEAFAAAGQRR